jgi:ferredoxin
MKIKEIKVDQDICIGCGSCEAFAPKAFEIRNGKSLVKETWAEEGEDNIKNASSSCPVIAISIIEE